MNKREEDSSPNAFNRQIHFIDQMLSELDRMREEMNWRATHAQQDSLLDTGT
jgi:hypothetical protein